jgi:hypothetical protein
LVHAFTPNAQLMIQENGGDAVSILSAALAHISGYTTNHKKRSLLTGNEGYVTIQFMLKSPAQTPAIALDYLRNNATGVREPRVCADGSIVVDVPEEDAIKIGRKIN